MKKNQLFFIFGIIGMIAMVIYAFFRAGVLLYSLSIVNDWLAILIIIVFVAAEFFLLVQSLGYFYSVLTAINSYKRMPIKYGTSFPEVTFLIPVRDEPIEILRKTIVACRYVDYPNFKIMLVESCDDQILAKKTAQLCQDQGILHFRVPYPRHGAKAGSINEALKEVPSPYFVILDADYRPNRDFLKLLVPQMEKNKKLAYVQTPQFYGNLTSSIVSRAAQLQQSIFQEYVCESKSVHQGMFMCGTNLIIRKKALLEVGGFDESSITEDFATSINILEKGWQARFYNFTGAFGDGPQNLREYFRQQYRWARGNFGVFLQILPKLIGLKSPLNFNQRIEFILSGSYYLVGIVWLILIIVPALYILFGIKVYHGDPLLYVIFYSPYFIISLLFFFQTLINRHYHLDDWLKAESLTILTTPVYARAVFDAFLGRRAVFEKTVKNVVADTIPLDRLVPQLIVIGINFYAIIHGIILMILTGFNMALMVNVFWCCFHVFIFSYLLVYIYVKQSY